MARKLAEKSKGNYTAEQIEKQMEGMAMAKNGVTEGGTPAVAIGHQPEGNWVQAGVTTDGQPVYVQVLSPEDAAVRAYIVQSTTGNEGSSLISYEGPYVAPSLPITYSSTQLPPAPEGTQRITVIVDGLAYHPLVASCPAAGCTSGSMVATALNDEATQAYITAKAKSVEKEVTILTSGLGLVGSAVRGLRLVGGVVSEASSAPATASIGTSSEAPFSRIVIGGGLQAHENAGGHLLSKHVGQSERALMTRMTNEPQISGSSSFYDRATAESAVSKVLDANHAKIADWLTSGSSSRLRLDSSSSNFVGISVSRGATRAVDVSSNRVILVRDPSTSTGYRILTGFPTEP